MIGKGSTLYLYQIDPLQTKGLTKERPKEAQGPERGTQEYTAQSKEYIRCELDRKLSQLWLVDGPWRSCSCMGKQRLDQHFR